jgi:hypothetical protein
VFCHQCEKDSTASLAQAKQSNARACDATYVPEPKKSGEQETYAPHSLSRKALHRQLRAGTRSNAPHGFSLRTQGVRRKRAQVWVAEFLDAFDVDAGIMAPDLLHAVRQWPLEVETARQQPSGCMHGYEVSFLEQFCSLLFPTLFAKHTSLK